jgi:hypothetical protein
MKKLSLTERTLKVVANDRKLQIKHTEPPKIIETNFIANNDNKVISLFGLLRRLCI